MKLLVLGGTHHVGRAVVETALERGDEVTTLNRGLSRPPAPGVHALVADRTDTPALTAPLRSGTPSSTPGPGRHASYATAPAC
jgi:uncharacterized protein YbjT (DUF2867 family)